MTDKTQNNRTENTRLVRFLKNLLVEATGHLDYPQDSFNDRVEQLAQRLANEGIIVLVGDLHPSLHKDRDQHIQAWVDAYAELYYLLNYILFETTDEPTAYIADNKYPVIVVFKARTLAVIKVLTGLIIPYIAKRQADQNASRAELRGMIMMMLEELHALDLPIEAQQQIRNRGVHLLDGLLKSKIRQGSLTNFSRQFMIDTGATQTAIEDAPRPDSLPELPAQRVHTGDLSSKPTPDKILKMPLPSDSPHTEPPLPRPSLLNRMRRSE